MPRLVSKHLCSLQYSLQLLWFNKSLYSVQGSTISFLFRKHCTCFNKNNCLDHVCRFITTFFTHVGAERVYPFGVIPHDGMKRVYAFGVRGFFICLYICLLTLISETAEAILMRVFANVLSRQNWLGYLISNVCKIFYFVENIVYSYI